MTEPTVIRYEQGEDGIVTLVLDDPNKSANTMTDAYRASMDAVLDRLESERDDVTGVILTSAKETFFAGGDLNRLLATEPEDAAELTARVARTKGQLRRLERLGRPVVAAINGTALGGGAEIALACHHRVMIDSPQAKIGFPEVTLGLLPGAGGVVRTTRLIGIVPALEKLLIKGQQLGARAALELGLVDEVATDADDLMARARVFIVGNPGAQAPWDVKGFQFPGGDLTSKDVASLVTALPAGLRKRFRGAPAPAPHNIMCAAVDGARVDFDNAQAIETRYFVELATGQIAKNMIQAFFFDMQSIAKGASRPDGFEPTTFRKAGVLGAGMMGSGIAYACAAAGMEVVLKDVSTEAAEQGKAYSARLLDQQVTRGSKTADQRDEFLTRITATGSAGDLGGCDIVIEAVFEDPELKAKVFAEVEDVVGPDVPLCSNTSTLPITGLAESVDCKGDFIGLHFFSPVEKMRLLEIICGGQTAPATLAKAFDFAQQIRKTPIVVNDSRGFFTSRVFGCYTREGVSMLADGVPAASIEQASSHAGYPVPVLQLVDEVSLTLSKNVREEYKRAALESGQEWVAHPSESVINAMVDEHRRPGRAGGAGFYEYDNGKRMRLWSGLSEAFGPVEPEKVPLRDMIDRLLISQAVETVKCFDEGVLTSPADANVGSLLGIGFPAWTGGVVQYINGYPGGTTAFVARAEELAERYGPRFTPPESLVAKAAAGESLTGDEHARESTHR
jgi:3-hydroxyacyl-CoA dehydrogenase/enoyl-CoA hydratase/3-hydroxybutyryl-CoA epimerase